MKNFCRILAVLVFSLNSLQASSEDRKFSLGLHGFESLLGNYGLTSSIGLTRHISLSLPLEFYSFAHSLTGSLASKVAQNLATTNGLETSLKLSMMHLRVGLGAKFSINPDPFDSGVYLEPIVYGGWVRTSSFSSVEFDNQREVIDSLATVLYRDLPNTDHFAVSPQLNIGYQWVSHSGLLFQLAAYGNYVYSPSLDSVFNASDRFFASNAINNSNKSKVPQNAIEMFRAFGTQMPGWHAGLIMNFGFAL